MVGHLLEYHPGIRQLKQIVDSGELGQVHYIYSNRLNLGKLRADENALWSLGAHDVSVVLHLAGQEPNELAAHGESYVRPGVEDVVFCFMRFPLGARRSYASVVARPPQGAAIHGGRLQADGDVRRHGPRAQADVYDKGFDGKAVAGTSTSPDPGTSTARRLRTSSLCGSNASTSSSASAPRPRRSRRRKRAPRGPRAGGPPVGARASPPHWPSRRRDRGDGRLSERTTRRAAGPDRRDSLGSSHRAGW